MMRFSKNRPNSFTRELIISGDYLPLAINKKFDSIHVGRIDIEQKPLGNHFWID
jgi:hypothetical protein